MTTIKPFRGRVVRRGKPVKVYRNLHRGGYSLQQGGLVVGHADRVVLKDAVFVVNEGGRQRVIQKKRKNVHAFVVGCVAATAKGPGWIPSKRISYNPYKAGHFTDSDTGRAVKSAPAILLDERGCWAQS